MSQDLFDNNGHIVWQHPDDSVPTSEYDDYLSSVNRSSNSSTPSLVQEDRYLPPQKRGVKLDMGDQVVVEAKDDTDKQGVESKHFKKLLIFISYALTSVLVKSLTRRFPGCFFVSNDHHNHDHPVSHAVTHVATRFLQRMIKPGSKILDVFGSPRSCIAFNKSQQKASNPKQARALVSKSCSADFIREVNKWGPWLDMTSDDQNKVMYDQGTIKSMGKDYLKQFSVFQLIHTLYYLGVNDVYRMLMASPGSKMLALIHTHPLSHGTINDGEQEYWVRGGFVRQRNTKTRTEYYHPDITPFWLRADKTWISADGVSGFTWEMHYVCEETWIVEAVYYDKRGLDEDAVDYKAMFERAEMQEQMLTRRTADLALPPKVLPTKDGKFVELSAVNIRLFNRLRVKAMGRSRVGKEGAALMSDLYSTAKQLVDPGSLFPDAPGMECPEHLIADHVVAAFVADHEREGKLMEAVGLLRPILEDHARAVKGASAVSTVSLRNLMDITRTTVKLGINVNKLVRNRDPIGFALDRLDEALD